VIEIPVFHENLYGTAVVALAALINALELVDKQMDEVRVVICGAGTVGIGCARLLLKQGVLPENLLMYDVDGLIHTARKDLHQYQQEFASDSSLKTLTSGLVGADVFLGASAGGVLNMEMIRSMARFPIIFAMATPDPEISYEEARASRQDAIVATASDMHPNAIVDLLSFPYIIRGALDVQATSITEGMFLAAARSLAELAREDVPEEVERAYGGCAGRSRACLRRSAFQFRPGVFVAQVPGSSNFRAAVRSCGSAGSGRRRGQSTRGAGRI